MLNQLLVTGIASALISPAIAEGGNDQAQRLHKLVMNLPATLEALEAANRERIDSGITLDMVEGTAAIGDGLLPALAEIVATQREIPLPEARESIEKEARAVALHAHMNEHATGWGGTIARIFTAGAYSEHIQLAVCYHVTQLFDGDESFDLGAWHEAWRAAGGSTGNSVMSGDEPDEIPRVGVDEAELKFEPGTSGGVFADHYGELDGGPISFRAKPGQRLVMATTVLETKLDRVDEDGSFQPITGWASAHDLELPASKGGRYRIHFSAGDREVAPVLLVEIR